MLASAGGAIYEAVAYFAISQFLTLGALTIADKQVPVKLKPIAAQRSVSSWSGEHQVGIELMEGSK